MEHLQTGTKVERRRREDRGAEGAEWLSAASFSMEAPKAPSARAPQARVSMRRRRPVDKRRRRQYVGA